MDLIESIAQGLGGATKTPYGYLCRCPCHKSTTSDLKLQTLDSGTVIPNCTKGCNANEISAVIREMGLLQPRAIIPEPETESFIGKDWLALPETPADPVLPGVFDKGDKVVIIGKSKTRKSFFAQQLAFCLASSRTFLQFPALEKCKVLIIQFEIKKHRYHARCLRMAERMCIDPYELDQLVVVNARGCADPVFLVKEQVRKHKPAVVIVDPLYKLITGDENKSEDIKPILKVFDQLAEETGAAIVYVHHDKKGSVGESELTDRGSGSGLLGRDFDSAILLAAHETLANGLVAEFVTRNYQSPDAFTVEWMNYCFGRSDALPKKKTARSGNGLKSKLTDLVLAAQGMLAKVYLAGETPIGMGVLNDKLRALGIARDMLTDVKDTLVDLGVISVGTGKAGNGQSPKSVTIHAPKAAQSTEIAAELKDNEPWF